MSQEIQQADNGEYLPEKPLEQRKRELAIRRSLLEQGVDRKIADAVVGYTPEQVPFIYKAESHEVLHHRVRDNWIEGYELIPGESSLWIGTTDAIHNLVDSQGWRDQISEVIVQWRGSHIEESDQQPEVSKVTRSEAHPIEGGAFVLIVTWGNLMVRLETFHCMCPRKNSDLMVALRKECHIEYMGLKERDSIKMYLMYQVVFLIGPTKKWRQDMNGHCSLVTAIHLERPS